MCPARRRRIFFLALTAQQLIYAALGTSMSSAGGHIITAESLRESSRRSDLQYCFRVHRNV